MNNKVKISIKDISTPSDSPKEGNNSNKNNSNKNNSSTNLAYH